MDTAAKRFTAQLISLPFRGIATPPNSVSTAADRVAIAYRYSGSFGTTVSAGFIELTDANISSASSDAEVNIPCVDGSIYVSIANGSIQIP
jgi:hypothetical protein